MGLDRVGQSRAFIGPFFPGVCSTCYLGGFYFLDPGSSQGSGKGAFEDLGFLNV